MGLEPAGGESVRVAVISDSHDNLPNLDRAVALAEAQNCEALLHCGDLSAPFVVKHLAAFRDGDGPVHVVFGNNDGDRYLQLRAQQAQAPNVTLHGEYALVELGGKTLGLTHYELYARGMAALGEVDACFFGHSHEFHEERVNGRLVLNPGEILGMKGPPTLCIYDTEADAFEKLEV
jgi:putative phosphoesterase